jgi:folate-dependent phosphoribosylglycinamide formyltransferase PurN
MKLLFILAENTVKGLCVLRTIAPQLKADYTIEVALNKTGQQGFIQKCCEKNAIRHFIVRDRNLSEDELRPEEYDCVIVCGWGWLISGHFISRCRKIVNCHSSLLPDYRGVSAYIHYWANCELHSGVTIHVMTPKFDDGRLLLQRSFPVGFWCSSKDILRTASESTAKLLLQFIGNGCPYAGDVQATTAEIRYFKKIGRRAIIYRAVNMIFRLLGLKFRIYTPHKKISQKKPVESTGSI